MILIKAGAKVVSTVRILAGVASVYQSMGYDTIITSGNDSTHMTGSLHYTDNALDFRIFHVPNDKHATLIMRIKQQLGKDYDAILEDDHIHVEYDPKGNK